MSTAIAINGSAQCLSKIENVLIKGDLKDLNEQERHTYYMRVCETLNFNSLTKPFDYITLNGKLVLYANKGAAEQLRKNFAISIKITDRQTIEGVYIVSAAAAMPDGRVDESTGAVSTGGLKGEALANAMMKAETKAKRRVTLSICGLNMLDETEVEDIPSARRVAPQQPEVGDGFKALPGSYRIPQGAYARKGLHEISEEDLRKDIEMREMKASPEEWEVDFIARAKQYLETLAQMEPGEDADAGEAKVAPKCVCGGEFKYSDRSSVWYCGKFKSPVEHSKNMPDKDYKKRCI